MRFSPDVPTPPVFFALVFAALQLSPHDAMAQTSLSMSNCRAKVVDLSPNNNNQSAGSVDVKFQVVDTNYDKTGNEARKVFINFVGQAQGSFGGGVLQSGPVNMIVDLSGATSVDILPGDRSEDSAANVIASGVTSITKIMRLSAIVSGCYIQ